MDSVRLPVPIQGAGMKSDHTCGGVNQRLFRGKGENTRFLLWILIDLQLIYQSSQYSIEFQFFSLLTPRSVCEKNRVKAQILVTLLK